MKYLLLFPLALILSCHIYAQETEIILKGSKSVGITTNVSIINYTYRATLNPHFAMDLGKAKFSFGPTLLIASNIGIPNTKSPKLTGMQATVVLTQSSVDQKINFSFSSDLIMQRIADHWDANAYDYRTGNYANFQYRNVEYLFQYFIGYGFQLKLGQNFYLTKGIGLGYYFSKLKGKELSANSPEIENFDYRGYKDGGFAWQVKLGVGFTF